MFQFPGISSIPLRKTCISTSQRVSALWNPTPRLLFLLGTIPPFPATTSSLKPQESNPGPRPTYTASAAGPLPAVSSPCPGPAHVHSLGLGCSSTSVCLKIFSVQFLVLSARARRLSKWASSSVFSAWPNFSSVNCRAGRGSTQGWTTQQGGREDQPCPTHLPLPPGWNSGPKVQEPVYPIWDPDQTATLPWASACSSVTWDGWSRAGGSRFVSEIQ